jgi:hypothetical protein
MTTEQIQKLKENLKEPIYDDLVEFLSKQLRDLKNIDNVRDCSKAQDQAVELKAQKKAYDKLDAILSTIIYIKSEPEIAKPEGKNDFGV